MNLNNKLIITFKESITYNGCFRTKTYKAPATNKSSSMTMGITKSVALLTPGERAFCRRLSHRRPKNSGGQSHIIAPFMSSRHTPPFWQEHTLGEGRGCSDAI